MGWRGQGPPGRELWLNGGRVRARLYADEAVPAGWLPQRELGRALRGAGDREADGPGCRDEGRHGEACRGLSITSISQ